MKTHNEHWRKKEFQKDFQQDIIADKELIIVLICQIIINRCFKNQKRDKIRIGMLLHYSDFLFLSIILSSDPTNN